jgi:hypothetical protein
MPTSEQDVGVWHAWVGWTARSAFLLLIPVVVWAVSIAAAEGAFRLLGATPSTQLEGLYKQLPNGNYMHRPSVDADANWFGAKFTVHTDSLGFRCDRDRRYAVTPTHTVDILLVGDSQAYGQGVSFEDSVAGTFISRAASDGKLAVNVAVGGHLLQNQLELLQMLSDESALRGRHVVLVLTPYLLAWPGDSERATVGPDGRLYGSNVTRWKQFMVELKTRLVVYSKLRDAVRMTVAPPQTDDGVLSVFIREFETGAAETRRAEAFLKWMSSFKLWTERVGADIHLVYAPLTLEFTFSELREHARRKGVEIDADAPYRVAALAADRFGLPLYDLRPTLLAIHQKGERLSLEGDPHYNPAVSIMAGTSIWTAVRGAMGH